MKLFALAVVTASLALGTGFASASQTVTLASVAHRLGFVYAYLGPDDEVSLTGHGLALIVRPGYPYFTVNDRREPVSGDAPSYAGDDLLISPAFAAQLTKIERSAALTERATNAAVLSSRSVHVNRSLAVAGPRRVESITIAAVPGSDDVTVSGRATPGAFIAITLVADVAPELPTIYLNRSFATAHSDGTFAIEIPTAPNYFSGSTLVAQASSIDDAIPLVARFTPASK